MKQSATKALAQLRRLSEAPLPDFGKLLGFGKKKTPDSTATPDIKPKYKKPKKWTSAGGVVTERGDPTKVYVIKPSNNYGPWAFPKGQVDKGETLAQAAIREVWEETGMQAKIQIGKPYLGKGVGSYSVTHFYLMTRTGGSPANFDRAETEKVVLVPWAKAIALFKKAGNKRDVIIAHRAMRKLGIKLEPASERDTVPA